MFDLEKIDNLKNFVVHAGIHPIGVGHIMRLRFPNGYGASIIRTPFSYGGDDGLFELAVLKFGETDNDFSLTYETPITDDVLGHLEFCEVVLTLNKIKNLPPRDTTRGIICDATESIIDSA